MQDRPTSEQSAADREAALLGRVRRGDRAAFTELYQRFQPRLFVYLMKMLDDVTVVEEVVDDVMFVVWKDSDRFRGSSKVSTWIFGIAYRQALSASRRERRYQGRIDRKADTEVAVSPRGEIKDWLESGLAALSKDHRNVVLLTYVAGFSYGEIAEIVGCPVNTVKTRMFHARRRLKVLLPRLSGERGDSSRDQA